MSRLRLLSLLSVVVLLPAPACLAQMITVRIVNATNGHSLQKQPVSLSLLYGDGEVAPSEGSRLMHSETDAHGEARFNLPKPPPAHLSAQVRLTSEHWRCGCSALVSTQEVIQRGFVGVKAGEGLKQAPVQAKAEPGEILFVARPLTFVERLLYPLEKQ
ncbi:MAG: hypothetical protein ACRD2G_09360 [Terriglobia bacterium]